MKMLKAVVGSLLVIAVLQGVGWGECLTPNCTDFLSLCDQLRGQERLQCMADWQVIIARLKGGKVQSGMPETFNRPHSYSCSDCQPFREINPRSYIIQSKPNISDPPYRFPYSILCEHEWEFMFAWWRHSIEHNSITGLTKYLTHQNEVIEIESCKKCGILRRKPCY